VGSPIEARSGPSADPSPGAESGSPAPGPSVAAAPTFPTDSGERVGQARFGVLAGDPTR